MKKVSIIIPFKGQTESELMLPLASIYNQIGIDLSQLDVHLVNDGGEPINLKKFDVLADKLEINYYEISSSGPGVARQYGIDHSNSEYIMFIDADDVLYYVGALWPFYNAANQGHQMILAGYWEQVAGNPYTYIVHNNKDVKAVYGKWYKRTYLEMINLRFLVDLPIYEDTYFVGLAWLVYYQLINVTLKKSFTCGYVILNPLQEILKICLIIKLIFGQEKTGIGLK